MQKYLTIGALITAAVCLAGLWYALVQALDAREQVGWNKAVLSQTQSDLMHTVAVMEKRNAFDQKLMDSIPSIYDNDDGSRTGASVGVWLPARKPDIPDRGKTKQAKAN